QAFATAMGGLVGNKLAQEIREAGMRAKKAVDQGKNGVYVGAELNLLFQLEGNCNLLVKADSSTDYCWQVDIDETVTLNGECTAEAFVEAGAKFLFVEGYLKIGGEIIA